ncbi:hypothetical protein LR48_Vigan10g055400 [Vigna angularis]|uniref:SHSP domain-containing protein n=1 Tax=Phaseolus angularis TaxID=3914 RepID=A0A0L9VID1_PHAAN|nr:hypothetical protein LR48_Vigan10g055400 [Vigna angularis]
MRNSVLVPLILLVLAGFPSKAKGYLQPLTDRPGALWADIWSDRFLDPYRVLEQIPFGVGKDQASMAVSPARVDWKETPEGHVIIIRCINMRVLTFLNNTTSSFSTCFSLFSLYSFSATRCILSFAGPTIMIDVPGLKKDEIKIEIEGNRVLRVSGERKKEEEKEGDHWHRVERSYGKFWRQFKVPENVDFDSLRAKLENGVLTLTMAKLSPDKIKVSRLVSIAEDDQGKQDL